MTVARQISKDQDPTALEGLSERERQRRRVLALRYRFRTETTLRVASGCQGAECAPTLLNDRPVA